MKTQLQFIIILYTNAGMNLWVQHILRFFTYDAIKPLKWSGKTTHASLVSAQTRTTKFMFLTCCDIRLDASLQTVAAAFCIRCEKA